MTIHLAGQDGTTSEHSLELINESLSHGLLDPNGLAWKPGLTQWVPLKTIDGVVCPKPPPLPEIRKEDQLVKEPAPFQEELSVKKTHYQLPNNWILKKKEDQTPERREQSDIVFLEGVDQAWPRLLARLFDFYAIAPIAGFFCGVFFAFYDFAQFGFMGSILEIVFTAILSVFFMIYYEAFCLSKKGATLGKIIAGIKVLDQSGNLLDFRNALRRSHMAVRSGCCYFIYFPIASVWSFGNQKKILAGGHQLSWDKLVDAKTICKRVSTLRVGLLVVSVLVLGLLHQVLKVAEKQMLRQQTLREETNKSGRSK
jgi:uncharacterized RDD family membrane protein YckC